VTMSPRVGGRASPASCPPVITHTNTHTHLSAHLQIVLQLDVTFACIVVTQYCTCRPDAAAEEPGVMASQ
jgi:hypothetical protein